ncbi:protein FAR1-RELATED SEQUENCE 6-like [Macadamia integrifolia]|uniref:protein FAR1-RELATED SEQUENCE 6-like n=1 Tax=Macadamia integrifolia TaxID=60698 RepID=UPI001C4FD09B|nr:protein FAR1-RELATED SEQUENCE 6-like [Macadamia integrifolia]
MEDRLCAQNEMEEPSFNSETLTENEDNEIEVGNNDDGLEPLAMIELDSVNSVTQRRKESTPPVVGMEFESYDEAYNFYNCYAKEVGFGIRVRNLWRRQKTNEKYMVVLCCSNQGFRRKKDTHRLRPETRIGCLAMVRIKLMSSERWRLIEVKLEHNHSNTPATAQFYKSHRMMNGFIRKLELGCDAAVQTTDLVDEHNQLELKEEEAEALQNYLCKMQLVSPSFFYLMDLNNGRLRNVFWADGRSRASYGYFGDVVIFDTTYLMKKYDLSFAPFVGVNHHGQSVLLGCSLLVDESVESFVWLFKTWLTCMSGRSPSTIITDHNKALQKAIAEVLPETRHRMSLWHIMERAPEKLKLLHEFEEVKMAMSMAVYDSLRVDEFETAWEDMVQHYGVQDNEWLQMVYEDRQHWVPAFLKDTFSAGMATTQRNQIAKSFFDGYVHKHTNLKDFLGKYELALVNAYQKEAKADIESRDLCPCLKTRCCYERQLSQVYTCEIFRKFQHEVEEMLFCFNTAQVHVSGPIVTYIVKERVDGNANEIRDYEVQYNTADMEVHCICGCFSFNGYLCKHALSVLNYNGVEEIPPLYILPRWRKDFKHVFVPNHGSIRVDIDNSVEWYDHLYKRAILVVEEGMISPEHFKVALQSLEDSLSRVHLVEDIELNITPTRAQRSMAETHKVQDLSQVKRPCRPKQSRGQVEKICEDTWGKNDTQVGSKRLRPIEPATANLDLGNLVGTQLTQESTCQSGIVEQFFIGVDQDV